jgi:sporulation protein YlmC with PRC-barrel domain
MKKTLFKILSVGVIVLSVLFFAFGLMKLARAQEPPKAPTIVSGIPGVEVIVPSPINTNQAQYIIASSLAMLGLGVAGFVVSSRITEVSHNNQNKKNTVTINLSPEDSAKLFEKATKQGKDVSTLPDVSIVTGERNLGTITINLSPEDSAKLFEKATKQGKDVSTLPDVSIVTGEGNLGTITINLSPDASAKLFEKAANQGKDISVIAYELLVKILDGEAQD